MEKKSLDLAIRGSLVIFYSAVITAIRVEVSHRAVLRKSNQQM